MTIKYVILLGLFLIYSVPAKANTSIADGGTNSVTGFSQNAVMWSSSGQIVQNLSLVPVTNGGLTIGQTGVSTSMNSPVKLMIQGSDSSQANGPHIQAYTATDSYPLTQILSYTHDNAAISFDSYYDGSNWVSSHSGSNFQLFKNSNALQFRYASGVTQGSNITTYADALSISDTGNTTAGTSITLPTSASGATATALSYYEEWTTDALEAVFDGNQIDNTGATFVRVGNKVTVSLSGVGSSLRSETGPHPIYLQGIPSRFVPSSGPSIRIRTYSFNGDTSTYTFSKGYIKVGYTSNSFAVYYDLDDNGFPDDDLGTYQGGWTDGLSFSYEMN